MSGLVSAMYDSTVNFRAEDMGDAIDEFCESSLTEKIRAVLAFHDENGLHPTDNATAVVMAVIAAVDATDEHYLGKGTPSQRRYAADAKYALGMLVDNTPVTR